MLFKKFLPKATSLILLFSIIQVLSSTYFLKLEGVHAANSILFLICGIGISFSLLYSPPLHLDISNIISKQQIFKMAFIAILLPVSYEFARREMDGTPVQIEYADMLPIIKVMSQRFLAGEWNQTYETIPEIWNGIQPIYLPALWLPFTSSLIFDFDPRWVTVMGIWLSVILSISVWNIKKSFIVYPAGIFLLLIWFHLDKTNDVIRLTEEGVVFFYYTLMVVAIVSKNPFFIGASAVLCLLSRYAIIGWLPFAIAFLILSRQYQLLLKTIVIGFIGIALIMVPFGLKPLLIHLQLPEQYIIHSKRVWNEHSEYFYKSLGMAKFFGPNHVQELHTVLTIGSFLFPLIFLIIIRKINTKKNNLLLSGFVLSITFFYNFLPVSYLYLYYTPVFVSLAISGCTMNNKAKLT